MRRASYLMAAAALGLLMGMAPSHAARYGRLSAQDRSFITKASQAGATEVQLGQLAASKQDGERVRQFAQRMIQQHSGANNKLANIAANLGVAIPMNPQRAMGAQGRATYDRLQRLHGAHFAQVYMDDMVRDHHKAIALFTREARYGTNPQLRTFARQMLPVLDEHLALAGQVDAMVDRRSPRMYAHRRM